MKCKSFSYIPFLRTFVTTKVLFFIQILHQCEQHSSNEQHESEAGKHRLITHPDNQDTAQHRAKSIAKILTDLNRTNSYTSLFLAKMVDGVILFPSLKDC